MAQIKKLTKKQQAYLPVFRQKYLDMALDPKRIDRDRLLAALTDAYVHISEAGEPRLITCDSPYRCMIAIKVLEDKGVQLDDAEVSEWVDYYIESGETKRRNMFNSSFLWGSQDMYWIAWGRFGQYLGVQFNELTLKLLDIVERIGMECEWWWPFRGLVVASEKPIVTMWDENRRLHAVDGPAVRYADGYSLYAWHGVRVPGKWIESKDIRPEEALAWPNLEQRRAACEILGWDAIVSTLKGVVIDQDDDPQIGTLLEVHIPEIGKERFLRVLCPTGRTFCLCVPPDMKTARQANSWTWGLSPSEYNPEVQT